MLLKDVSRLVRANLVAAPSGFTKRGNPILYFPDDADNEEQVHEDGGGDKLSGVGESDLLLLLRYYLSVVPKAEQSSGFALLVDRRRSSDWSRVRRLFRRVAALFPARIREAYLLHSGDPRGVTDLLSRLSAELLLDFDVFAVSDPSELLRHVEAKSLPDELGGQAKNDVEGWITLQVWKKC